MSDFVIGIPIGMGIGISIGLLLGQKIKPWSELSEEEKKTRKKVVGAGMVLLLSGIMVCAWFLIS